MTGLTLLVMAWTPGTELQEPMVLPVSITVTTVIAAPIADVFAFEVAEDVLPKVLHRYGPIPPVVGTQVVDGPWERIGAWRRVFLKGGGFIGHEQITHFRAPTQFAYEMRDYHGTPLKALAVRGIGSWIFTDLGDKTRIDWTYSFEPTGWLAKPILSTLVHTFWKGWMKQALNLSKEQLEAHGVSREVVELGRGGQSRPRLGKDCLR